MQHDRPSPQELAEAVREFLQNEILPILDDHRLKFRTLVAINGLGIAERELWATTPPREDDWELARRIRAGDVPENAVALLKEQVAQKLRVSNPALPGEVRGVRRRLILMRHGDVSYVDEAGAPVKPEDVPLTSRGREQAAAARDALANVELDLVVASDLPRTLETAEIVAPGKHVELWPELAEWRGGRLDAIPPDELEAAFVGALQVRDEAQRFLGGESLGEALDRVHPARAAARPGLAHRARRPPRRRQPDRHLVRALGRPHLLRDVRAGPGVHQRARRRRRRLDRPHGQLRPLRPAPPRPDDDDGAPLGAAAAVPTRAP